MPLLVGRAATALAVAGAALALTAPPALATVTATTDGMDHVFIESDDLLDDPVSMTCVGGEANVNGSSALPALQCTDVTTVVVDAPEGAQAVNLGGVTELAFPALVRTTIDVDDTDADSITGSEGRDVVDADSFDTVTGGLGDDWVEGAGTASGGEGDDVLRNISNDVQGGSGDDRIVNPGGGTINGGDGRDVVVQDYTASPVQQTVTLYVSNATLGPAPGVGTATGIEEYDLTTSTGVQADTIDSTAFSGVVVVATLDGDDTVRGGPGADVVDAGPGNDNVNPGGGADLVRGGDGDDTINARDGVADSIECGPGADTVIADRADALSGCENVSLPPPETSAIVGETKVRKNDKVLFAFAASVSSATFEYAIDGGPYKPCTSPLTVKSRKLSVGKHTLSVRAVQPAGNADPTPSTLVFKVKHKKKK